MVWMIILAVALSLQTRAKLNIKKKYHNNFITLCERKGGKGGHFLFELKQYNLFFKIHITSGFI